jgi:hypothetical protein
MNRRIAMWFSLFVVFTFCSAAFAQSTSQPSGTGKQAPSSATTDNEQERNINKYVELLRTDIKQQKAEIMGAMMLLSSDQAAKFWPIYTEYDAELNKLNNLRLANIKEYARNYDQLTDAKADELIQNAIKYQRQRSELLEKYYGRVKESIGAIEAARFVQIENQLLTLIDLKIASALPVVPKGS